MNRCPFCCGGTVRLTLDYDECTVCDIWISRVAPARYDESYYYSRSFRSAESLHRARLQFDYFAREVSGRRCLDLGCNDGSFVLVAGERGALCVGVDVNESVVARARRSGGGAFRHVSEVAESYECVTAFDVVEHFADIDSFFSRVEQWLEPAGRLIITTPNKHSKWYDVFGRRWHGLRIPQYHRYVFSARFLKDHLARWGYSVEREFSVPPIERHGWRLLVASGWEAERSQALKLLSLPWVLAKFAYGKLIAGGEEDTLCLVARRC